jgi:hypothetical protein
MLCSTCVFAFGVICRTCSAFWCVRGVKRRHTVFMLRWDRYRFHKKHVETRYAELVSLFSVVSVGHVVHLCVCGVKHRHAISHAQVVQMWFP